MIKLFIKKIKENPNLLMSYVRLSFFYMKELVKNCFAFLIFRFNCKKYYRKNIWLISERKDEACDNGYFLFKYIRSHHPEINVYYCISKKSWQYNNVERYGNIIEYGSIKNYVYAYAADVRLSTLYNCPAPQLFASSFISKKIRKTINKYRKKFGCKNQITFFLQHGITLNHIGWLLDYNNENNLTDYIITGAKREQEYIIKTYSFPSSHTPCIGFCRWDNLQNKKSSHNYILVTLTWRNYVEQDLKDLPYVNFMSKKTNKCEKFKCTSYYHRLEDLLLKLVADRTVIKSKYKIVLYLHPNFQKYSSAFDGLKSRGVEIKTKYDALLCDLIRDCKILITDFSSVAFDAAYANKCIVYYQYDKKEFYSLHNSKGYFSYYKDGFGKSAANIKGVMSEIQKCIEGENCYNKKYIERSKNFFAFDDRNNCERTFAFVQGRLK